MEAERQGKGKADSEVWSVTFSWNVINGGSTNKSLKQLWPGIIH